MHSCVHPYTTYLMPLLLALSSQVYPHGGLPAFLQSAKTLYHGLQGWWDLASAFVSHPFSWPPRPHFLHSCHTNLLTALRKSKVPSTPVPVLKFLCLASPCPGSWLSWLPSSSRIQLKCHLFREALQNQLFSITSPIFFSLYWLYAAIIYCICFVFIYFYPRM